MSKSDYFMPIPGAEDEKEYKCYKCKDTGKCSECLGKNKCHVCGGSGRANETCKLCHGHGEVMKHGRVQECPSCNGTGRAVCYTCMGTGKCSYCRGTGKCTGRSHKVW